MRGRPLGDDRRDLWNGAGRNGERRPSRGAQSDGRCHAASRDETASGAREGVSVRVVASPDVDRGGALAHRPGGVDDDRQAATG